MPLLLHEELGDVDGVEEFRQSRVDGDDDFPDGDGGLVRHGVVAVVDAADGAALEDHVVLRQGARLITEYVLDLKIWTPFVDPCYESVGCKHVTRVISGGGIQL